MATRLGDLTRQQPKSMVMVKGKPFLEYQLEFLRKAGITDIVLCIGHLGDQIESYFGDGTGFGVNIGYSRELKLLGTAGALRKAEALLQDAFFTLYGDSYLFLDFSQLMSYFRSQGKLALMTVFKNCDRYDRSNTAIAGNMVTEYSKNGTGADMVYIDYGANVFDRRVLNLIPEDEPYQMEDLFPRLIEKGDLLAFEVKERFYEIGSLRGLADFTRFVRAGLNEGVAAQSRDNSRQ